MNTLRLLLAVSLCVASGARAAELKTNQSDHDVCEWNCAIEDVATVAKTFSRLVSEEKRRFVNLTIDAHTDSKSSLCKNSTAHNSTEFHPAWAVDEREPYLYLPSDLTGFSVSWSPFHSIERMTIDLDCNGKVRESAPGELNETSPLERAVARSLMQDLIREKGVLCFPRQSQDDIDRLYECCHFDQSTSAITCNAVRSRIARWIHAVRIFWLCVLVIMFLYLPAMLCLFPSLPKVFEDGTPCIELEDPSPAALRSLLVKAFVPRNTDVFLDQARLFVLKVVLIPCFFIAPVFLTLAPGFFNFYFVLGLVLYVLYAIHVVLELRLPLSAKLSVCQLCSQKHLDELEAVKLHVTDQLSTSTKRCRQFSMYYIKKTKPLMCFDPNFQSPPTALWCTGRIFFSALLFPFVLTGFLVGCTVLILFTFAQYSPVMVILLFDAGRAYRHYRSGPSSSRPCLMKALTFLALLSGSSRSGLHIWIIFTSDAWVTLLSYLIMTAIDFADTVLPILASSVLILYYLHKFFSSSSEKYQLLKIKLFQGVQQHHDSGGELLLSKSKTGGKAIPEDLYKLACRKLGMPMLKTFWLTVMKMTCLMVFVLSVSGMIMIFGARAGIAPLTKVVAIFLAGFLPQILSMFSAGGHQEMLQEYCMEMKLKDVITGYPNWKRDISTDSKIETVV